MRQVKLVTANVDTSTQRKLIAKCTYYFHALYSRTVSPSLPLTPALPRLLWLSGSVATI